MKTLIIFLSLAIATASFGQNAKQEVITNQTIIQLSKAGIGKDILKSKIQKSVCHFDLSTDNLIALKKAGVSDDVINAMMATTNSNETASAQLASNTAVQDNSVESGIYYCKGEPCKLMELEPSVYSQAKMGSGILTGITYGIAKTKMKATLSGSNANMQIEENNPVFYFYFDKNTTNNLGSSSAQNIWFSSATSPNEFMLIKFTESKNKKSREVVTGSFNSYAGLSSGIDDKYKVPFKYEKVSPGVYKVYTEKPLEAGEYCFMYAGGTTLGYGSTVLQKVYDFGVK